jgi:hypothetical protein
MLTRKKLISNEINKILCKLINDTINDEIVYSLRSGKSCNDLIPMKNLINVDKENE